MTLDILAQKNPFLMTTIRDFNAKSKTGTAKIKPALKVKKLRYNFPIRVLSVN